MSDQNTDQQTTVKVDELASELVSQNITTRRKERSLLFHIRCGSLASPSDFRGLNCPRTAVLAKLSIQYPRGIFGVSLAQLF